MASNANYAATVAVATTSYPAATAPQYTPTFGGVLCIQHPGTVSNIITFSFDGTNDAGVVLPGTAVTLANRYGPMWFKGAAATSTTIYVNTEGGL